MPRARTTLTAAALLAAGLGLPSAPAVAAGDPAKELPVAGCFTVTDTKGDAQASVLVAQAKLPYDADLDILGLTLRTTATSLVGYVKVADLAAGPASTDGHRYSLNFTFNGHVFSASGSAYKNGTGGIRDGLAQTGQAGGVTALGVDVPSLTAVPPALDKGFVDSGLKVTFDVAKDVVVFDLPIADITKYGGKAFGGTVTNVDARSTIDMYALGSIADTTNADNTQTTDPKKVYASGDNRCFPTRLALSVAKFPARRNVTAKLTMGGVALPGELVTFYVNNRKHSTARTAADGTAVLKNVKPGYAVKAVHSGPGYLGSTAATKV